MYSYVEEFLTDPANTTCYWRYDRFRLRYELLLRNKESKARRKIVLHTLPEVAELQFNLEGLGVRVKDPLFNQRLV